MNKLSASDRAKILQLLCEGMSIRAVTRVIGASKNTVFAELRRRFVAMARERRNVRSPRTN